MVFSDMGELEHALESKVVTLHTKIKATLQGVSTRKAIRRRSLSRPRRAA
jgi:hypothetical protein